MATDAIGVADVEFTDTPLLCLLNDQARALMA